MRHSSRLWLITCLLPAALVAAYTRPSRADTVTFQMTNVHWRNTTYIGNTSMPLAADFFGSGQFTWTYTPGDFAAGTGALVSLDLPPWAVYPSYPATTIVDANGITSTLQGTTNVDNLTYDIAMSFSPALTSPTQAASISSGSYQFAPGTYNFLSGEFDGVISGGTISPIPEPSTFALLSLGSLLLSVRRLRERTVARFET